MGFMRTMNTLANQQAALELKKQTKMMKQAPGTAPDADALRELLDRLEGLDNDQKARIILSWMH